MNFKRNSKVCPGAFLDGTFGGFKVGTPRGFPEFLEGTFKDNPREIRKKKILEKPKNEVLDYFNK